MEQLALDHEYYDIVSEFIGTNSSLEIIELPTGGNVFKMYHVTLKGETVSLGYRLDAKGNITELYEISETES